MFHLPFARNPEHTLRSTIAAVASECGAGCNTYMENGDLLLWGEADAVREVLAACNMTIEGIEVRDSRGRLWGDFTLGPSGRASSRLCYLFTGGPT